MDGLHLQDLISRGMGTAARLAGVVCDAFRPKGVSDPLAVPNRYLQLTATFNAEDPGFRRSTSYARPVWYRRLRFSIYATRGLPARVRKGPGLVHSCPAAPTLRRVCIGRSDRELLSTGRAVLAWTKRLRGGNSGKPGSATGELAGGAARRRLRRTRFGEASFGRAPGWLQGDASGIRDSRGAARCALVERAEGRRSDDGRSRSKLRLVVGRTHRTGLAAQRQIVHDLSNGGWQSRMADLSDVEEALVALVAGALYPRGTDTIALNGVLTRVYRGWPEAAALDSDLAAGCVNVTVFPEAGGRNTTRHLNEWLAFEGSRPTLNATVSGNTVTFAGSAEPRQLVGILADRATYVHPTGANETPASVAADLAAAMREDRIVLLSGSSIVIPGATRLLARVVAERPAMMETRRQEQRFRITSWCPDPAVRDRTAAGIDSALAHLSFIDLPDGSRGRIRYQNSVTIDEGEGASLYRRDLIYGVEYPTTLMSLLPTMLFADVTLQPAENVSATLTV